MMLDENRLARYRPGERQSFDLSLMAKTESTDPAVRHQAAEKWPEAFNTRLPFLIARTADRLFAEAAQDLYEHGLTDHEYCAMALIRDDAPRSQIELAGLMEKPPATVVAVIDQLESKGLVQRERAPEDRRRSTVTMTAKGERLLDSADQAAEDVVARALPALSRQERRQLATILLKALD